MERYNNYINALADEINLFTDEELEDFSERYSEEDEIVGIINREKSYRFFSDIIGEKDASFISQYYNLPLESIEINKSLEYLEQKGIDITYAKWCPMLFYLSKVERVATYLLREGFSSCEISKFICSSFEKTQLLSNSVNAVVESNSNNVILDDVIDNVVEIVKNSKHQTQSYSFYTNDMFEKNNDLLRRLS